MDELYDVTRQELEELRPSLTGAGGIRISPEAAETLAAANAEPGELAARYLEYCARSGRIRLIGYTLGPDLRPRCAGAVHVVLDPGSRGITIYEESC